MDGWILLFILIVFSFLLTFWTIWKTTKTFEKILIGLEKRIKNLEDIYKGD